MLYAGVQPAALFKSTDRGDTWSLIESLYDHPHRGQWQPGAGGLCLHTIVLDPRDATRMYIAISAAGVYRTDDGGKTWQPRNKNTRVDFWARPSFPSLDSAYTKWTCTPTDPMSCSSRTTAGYTVATTAATIGSISAKGSCPARFGFPIAVHLTPPNHIHRP